MGVDKGLKERAVFLDRDGVLIRAHVVGGTPHPPASPSEVEILPGVPEALTRLRSAGYRLIVITNQPDVARGRQTREAVEAIHRMLESELPLDEIRVCYHDDDDRCSCRKPEPGMIVDGARTWGIDLRSSYTVGDRWRDIEAGRRAGTRTILVDYDYGETKATGYDARVATLAEAAEWILSTRREHNP